VEGMCSPSQCEYVQAWCAKSELGKCGFELIYRLYSQDQHVRIESVASEDNAYPGAGRPGDIMEVYEQSQICPMQNLVDDAKATLVKEASRKDVSQ